jgi:hypothetical protein
MSIRIEQYDGGEVLYFAFDPDGVWARSEFPTELVTLDYNAQGGLIGAEVIGSAARRVAESALRSLLTDEKTGADATLEQALAPVLA